MIHTWSLAVEEQFYVAWVLLFIGMVQLTKSMRLLPVLGLALIGGGLSARAAGLDYWLGANHLDSFGLGILGAFLYGQLDPASKRAVPGPRKPFVLLQPSLVQACSRDMSLGVMCLQLQNRQPQVR